MLRYPVAVLTMVTCLAGDPTIAIQIRMIAGDEAAYPAGSQAVKGLTVEITDDQGQPVNAATVTFQLPEKGPGGQFAPGQHAVKVETRADGRASVAGMQWNQAAGTFHVKITAVKDQARAGMLVRQTLTAAAAPAAPVAPAALAAPKAPLAGPPPLAPPPAASEPVMPVTAAGGDGDFKTSHSFHWKWLALLGLAAGAGAGLWLKAQANSTITLSSPFLAAPQVGTPSITVGAPPK